MFIQQLYTSCLSEAAYYIESNGVAAIIDPLRDIDEYLQIARKRKATIKYIFETHFHADFVSGHIDLAKTTGATIIYGPETITKFPIIIAKDGDRFNIGVLSIEVLHTPGHTIESTCYLLANESGKHYCLFTGDTLFVGDVGRPDLAQKGEELTTNDLAGMLYDSIQAKIIPLEDDVIVYPAHGAGSSCGKNLGPDTYSTIGDEKKYNYALKQQSKDEFINVVTNGLTQPPPYFALNAKINKEGYKSLNTILQQGLSALSVENFKTLISEGVVILDTRHADIFPQGFVAGSISIGLEGRFAEWAGSLISFEIPMVLLTEPGREKETIIRLARVGFDKIKGYLNGGYDAWKQAGEQIDMIINVDPDELMMDMPFGENLIIIDVRKSVEFAEGHLKDAENIPLSDLTDPASMSNINDDQNLYIHCAKGYRSIIASSLLKRQGIHNLRNITGGWEKIKEQKAAEIVKERSMLN